MSYDTEQRLSATLKAAVGDRQYTPDLERIESRGRRLRSRRLAWRTTAAGGFAVAAIAAVAVATTGAGGTGTAPARNIAAPATTASASAAAAQPPLLQLVGYLNTTAKPEGDATLVLRDQKLYDGTRVKVWDLWADSGGYYFAKTRDGLPAQVKAGNIRGGDSYRQYVAAAKAAAQGDLNAARKRMIVAGAPKGAPVPTEAPGFSHPAPTNTKIPAAIREGMRTNIADNRVWNNVMDALHAGAGDPAVRAGALRLLNQMPEVKTVEGTLAGKKVLNLTVGMPALEGAAQTLTIDAQSGVPLKLSNGPGDNETTYVVTRVKLADVKKGTF
ncbi:hypothetical protein Ade02nite_89300 [Paractinoplanes deccanensis]|uniref:CU044_5270 family protein n=1 Tax=Paractinoplanes deccanensis TaxID=113561 RepID=A0ABQ3YJV4_9ACTN|nr:hypothetical protein [Actinoplanes deccanensis]GID80289.1 hypothetical protein Ade02nite_89300 [Actinoplanes deccanensis]